MTETDPRPSMDQLALGPLVLDAPSDQVLQANRQDLRLAVVLNGGVSLAVWMSGVVLELNEVVQASRRPDRTGVYAEVLDLLQADARIDVVSGTSAGGLNGGFLSLGLVHGCDLSGMRSMWADKGALGKLLRDPREKGALSLLDGQWFHTQLRQAYADIAGAATGRPARDQEPPETVDLFLSGTLWNGRRTAFTDDLGHRLEEVDHDATFHFSSDPEVLGEEPWATHRGDLRDVHVADELALASRCTSSFPGAFEPQQVDVDAREGDRWPSQAGRTDFADSQLVVDGGVLHNKPVRPALEAVYRQPAGNQVRRVLAYVVPDPGESARTQTPGAPPGMSEVLLAVMTRMRGTESISRELNELAVHNAEARRQRGSRERVARLLVTASASGDLVAQSFHAYREARVDEACETIATLLVGDGAGTRWSRQELVAALAENVGRFTFVPGPDLAVELAATGEQWSWGQSTVRHLGDLTIDVLRRAVGLCPVDTAERAVLVGARTQAHQVLGEIRRDRQGLASSWQTAGAGLPARSGAAAATQRETAALRSALPAALDTWERSRPLGNRTRLYGQALDLARCLDDARAALGSVAEQRVATGDPLSAPLDHLRSLLAVLLRAGPGGGPGQEPQQVLRQMLALSVVQVAFGGGTDDVEQEVELVQLSAVDPAQVTGLQLHHFGAFYRRSWRVSDWLTGRLDGAAQLLTILLSPARLAQLGLDADQAYDKLRVIAVGQPDRPDHASLCRQWDQRADDVRAELAPLGRREGGALTGRGLLPSAFALVPAMIARRLRVDVHAVELPALAQAVRQDDDQLSESRLWADEFEKARGRLEDVGELGCDRLEQLCARSQVIGRQLIAAEMTEGSDTFARTATHASAALSSTVTTVRGNRLLRTVVAGIRGYVVLVWLLVNQLTSRNNLGTNVVSLVVGVGATLIGLTLVIPSVPVAVPLIGALLMLSALSATALSRRSTEGLGLGARLALVCVLILAALAATVVWDLRDGTLSEAVDALLRGLGKVGLVAAVVLTGVFLAGAGRPARKDR